MAINLLQQPAAVAFAGDPIITKAKTTLTGKAFLRIKLLCQVKAVRTSEEYVYEESLSYSVSEDGIATFNVGSTIQTALDKYAQQQVNGTIVTQTLYAAKYQLTFKEVYLSGTQEVEGSTVVSEWFNAVMGSLSEYERMTMPNQDTTQVIGSGRMLTRKPEGEIIAQGIDLYVPAVSTLSDSISYYAVQGDNKKTLSKYTGGVFVPASLLISTGSLALGSLRIDTDIETGKEKTVVSAHPSMRHFLFKNSFGLIESISAIMREAMKYSIESNQYIIPSNINFSGYTRVLTYTQTPKVELDMSSGYVNREWAEWWINEFVTTREAWMLEQGRYIPVAIIPEDSNKLFDKSKPGMISVQFKVRYSFAGSTYNRFIGGGL